MDKLDIIAPCYNEEAVLPYFMREIRATAEQLSAAFSLSIHILFVDDGSKDGTLQLLRNYAETETNV